MVQIIGHSTKIDEAVYQHTMKTAMSEAMDDYERRTVEKWLKDEKDDDE